MKVKGEVKQNGPRSMGAYAKILKCIQDEPKTTLQIAACFDLSTDSAQNVCRRLWAAKLIRVADWKKNPSRGPQYMAMYKFEEGQDAPYPGTDRPIEMSRAKNLMASLIAIRSLLDVLKHPVSIDEAAELSGLQYHSVSRFIRDLRDLGMARICDYVPRLSQPGSSTRLFCLGSEPDAQKPKAMTNSQAQKRYYYARKAKIQQQKLIQATAGNDDKWSKAA